jgi:hypothetical protein
MTTPTRNEPTEREGSAMEPIVWNGYCVATVDGVELHALRNGSRHCVYPVGTNRSVSVTDKSRDLAARAVVAAVKVLRGKFDHESST